MLSGLKTRVLNWGQQECARDCFFLGGGGGGGGGGYTELRKGKRALSAKTYTDAF